METRIDVKIRAALETAVDRLRDEMVHILTDLVSIPSVVGSEGSAQDFMRRQYESIGLEVQTFEANKEKVRAHPAFVDSEIPFEGRPNVIGILRGDPRKKSIILNGHIDVVSPEPSDQWQYDPWGGEIEGNRLYGRGAMDMKAGLVTNLYAVKALASLGLKPGGTVMLQSVIEEEAGGGGGTLACLMEGYTADGMIITESHLFPVISHAGILYFRVKVKGKTAHAGRAHLGVNAIGRMMKIYQALEQLDIQRAATVKFPLYDKVEGRSCHLNIGTLKSGDWPSTVAGFAEMECRISYIPGESIADIKKTIEDVIHQTAQDDAWAYFQSHFESVCNAQPGVVPSWDTSNVTTVQWLPPASIVRTKSATAAVDAASIPVHTKTITATTPDTDTRRSSLLLFIVVPSL